MQPSVAVYWQDQASGGLSEVEPDIVEAGHAECEQRHLAFHLETSGYPSSDDIVSCGVSEL